MCKKVLSAIKTIFRFLVELWFVYMMFTLSIISASFLLEINLFLGVFIISIAITLIPQILKIIKSRLANW